MPAMVAPAGGIVFEELYHAAASGTFDVKNSIGIPVLGILSRAFHDGSPGMEVCDATSAGCTAFGDPPRQ
jgi:hypothetical protein